MIHPYNLLGLPYRLGADPEKHGAADCLTLARSVLAYQGIESPEPERSWYRRSIRGDKAVFAEELERWGQQIEAPKLVTVALCQSDLGLGMATYFENGWIAFSQSEVVWSPIDALPVVAYYSPTK